MWSCLLGYAANVTFGGVTEEPGVQFEAMMTSEQCRAYATECRGLVLTAASPQQKAILFDLALHWDMAAMDMEELERQKAADGQTQRI